MLLGHLEPRGFWICYCGSRVRVDELGVSSYWHLVYTGRYSLAVPHLPTSQNLKLLFPWLSYFMTGYPLGMSLFLFISPALVPSLLWKWFIFKKIDDFFGTSKNTVFSRCCRGPSRKLQLLQFFGCSYLAHRLSIKKDRLKKPRPK